MPRGAAPADHRTPTVDDLAGYYPRLYHMAAAGSWPSIERHGLLSTSALLDLFRVEGAERRAIESSHRPASVTIRHPEYGEAVIRDQIPLSDSGLRRALRDGLTPEDWYKTLNAHIFFWLTEKRLQRMLGAGAYRDHSHVVITLDTASLVREHSERVVLSPLNSGCTKPFPNPRGRDTFRPLATYPFHERRRSHRADAVVELAVLGGVPNVQEHVIEVRERRHDDAGVVIWKGPGAIGAAGASK